MLVQEGLIPIMPHHSALRDIREWGIPPTRWGSCPIESEEAGGIGPNPVTRSPAPGPRRPPSRETWSDGSEAYPERFRAGLQHA